MHVNVSGRRLSQLCLVICAALVVTVVPSATVNATPNREHTVPRCRCAEVALERYFERADIVVVGRVIRVHVVSDTATSPDSDLASAVPRIEIEIAPQFRQGRTFKGTLNHVVLATPQGSASCGVPVVAGQDYVLFANVDTATSARSALKKSVAWFDSCSGSRGYPTRDGNDLAAAFVGTPHNAVIPKLMALADAGQPPATPASSEFFTSPACWNEPRVTHFGAPGAAWRERVTIRRLLPMDSLNQPAVSASDSAILSPNGAYRVWSTLSASRNDQLPVAQVRVVTDKPSQMMLEARDAFDAPGVSWVNEKLLFVRIPWSRIAFTDLLIDVETAQPLYEEWARYSAEAMEQFREACRGQCPCLAAPGSADSGMVAPARPPAAAEMRDFDQLVPTALTYLDEDWDGRVYSEPAGRYWVVSALKGALGREEYPVDILERRMIDGTWWLEVALYRVSRCYDATAMPVHRGWVPAFSRNGKAIGSSWRRGC